ncbi:tyrosine recombinase XerC [Embleya sp. NPDC008237]|uniref:site-specific integrase n=1 Tax=Embleya sp. NPDC008237 TaxID=3363978 RepID=UPI0036F18373
MLQAKALTLKPTTLARYRDYVVNDLVPHLGGIRLDELGRRHLVGFARAQLAAGRGRVTVHRCMATLSSALGDAVRQHRLQYNPARPTIVPRPRAAERVVWSAREAVRFLRCCHEGDPLLADLCEVLIGTGMRKGEALGLHWADVHLDEGVLYVRYTLSAIDNNRLAITAPKTRSSRSWVAISPRVAAALRRRARASGSGRVDPADPFTGLVFTRANGRPLRPQTLLDRFRHWSAEAGVPRITMHDLRHLAATLTITAGVPLTVVSKTLRHSTLSTTANIYAHLTRQAAHDAVDAIEEALVGAEGEDARIDLPSRVRPHRDHPARLRDLFKPLYTAAVAGRSMTWLGVGRQPCDHTATTTPRDVEKAAFPFLRRRPPTCVNAGRDDRI